MIKKILAAGALAASAAFIVPQASAQTFSPSGSFTLTSIGPVTLSGWGTVACNLKGTGSVSGGSATVNSITVNGGGCGVIFMGMPYVVSSTSLTSITLNSVTMAGLVGSCSGSLTGSYNQSTGVITFMNATIPMTSGSGNCKVNGQFHLSPTVTFTIP